MSRIISIVVAGTLLAVSIPAQTVEELRKQAAELEKRIAKAEELAKAKAKVEALQKRLEAVKAGKVQPAAGQKTTKPAIDKEEAPKVVGLEVVNWPPIRSRECAVVAAAGSSMWWYCEVRTGRTRTMHSFETKSGAEAYANQRIREDKLRLVDEMTLENRERAAERRLSRG